MTPANVERVLRRLCAAANIKDVTNTGILTVAQVCQGITAACAALGVS